MKPGARWRGVGLVGAVIVLTLAVSIVARPAQMSAGPSGGDGAGHVLFDAGLYLLMALMALSLAVTIWALFPRRLPRGKPKKRSWWERLLPLISLALTIGLLIFLISDPHGLARLHESALAMALQRLRERQGGVYGAGAAQNGPDWSALALVGVLLLGISAFAVWRWRVALRRRMEPRDLALNLEEVLQERILALDPQAPEPTDPRAAVIAAWAGFEQILARNGVPPRPGEAPHEFLTRALDEVELVLDAGALRRFTDLFEWARYSTNPVTDEMRGEARAVLTAVRDGLHHHAVPGLHVVHA